MHRWWDLEGPNIRVDPFSAASRTRHLIDEDQKYLMTSTKEPSTHPLSIVRGDGPFLMDLNGNVFLDFCSGVGVLNLGHNHPEVKKAVYEQVERFVYYESQDFYFDLQVQAAKKLVSLAPQRARKVFFSNSGTESVEAAVKIAYRSRPLRDVGIAFLGSFHGRSLGSLSHTASKTVHKTHYPALSKIVHLPYPYCFRCPYNTSPDVCDVHCVNIIEELYFERLMDPNSVNYVLTEPIQGEGGYIIPPKGYFQKLQALCKRHEILLIDDEIQAGFGRTGRMLALEHWGMQADIICMAKSIAAGVPLGATVIPRELDLEPGAHSNTFGGNPIALNVMLKQLKVIEDEQLLSQATEQGDRLLKLLAELQESCEIIGDIRGKGLMIGIELVKDRKTNAYAVRDRNQVLKEALRRGLVILGCGRSVIRLFPPLIVTEEHCDRAVDILEESLKTL